ncbi:hypothetical protein OH77DRAFT_152716 [Trametes cingulata]|nr:hypothetical protein OH77DRAFT_152716 [Trametes cingulata]
MAVALEPASANSDTQVLLLAPLLAVTALCGAYTVLFVIAIYVFLRRGIKRRTSQSLLAIISALYASTVVHWVVSTKLQWLTISSTDSVQLLNMEKLALCVPDAALTVNTVLSDAVVWWRVWVIWERRPLLLVPALVLVLLTLVLSSINAADTCQASDISFARVKGPYFSNNPFGTATVIASLLTNLLAIFLIGYKAWQHRRFIKQYLSRLSRRTWAEEVLHMLVESAVVYCILWAFVLASALGSALDPTFLEASGAVPGRKLPPRQEGFTLFELVLLESLVPIIGMYPTLVVLLVTLKGSQLEAPWQYRASSHSLAPMSFQLRSASSPVAVVLDNITPTRTEGTGTLIGLEAVRLPPRGADPEQGAGFEHPGSRFSVTFIGKEDEAQEDDSTSCHTRPGGK